MKTNITIVLLALSGALAFSAGCGRKEGTALPAAKDTPTPADTAASQSQKAAEAQRLADAERAAQAVQATNAAKAAEAAKTEAMKQQAAAEKLAAEKAAAAAAQEKGRIQSLIDTAKSLTGQNKYAEALKVIADLSKLTLSPEQQTLVDGLKKTAEQQAAQAVADKAAAGASTAISDALGSKK